LKATKIVYPCVCSRQDVLRAASAPHPLDEEAIYPATCREAPHKVSPKVSWRFRVPDGEEVSFVDGRCGPQNFVAGHDFGDFVVWRHDAIPSYQLAVVVDDASMKVTEVVRGSDLLVSTARQILLYRALGFPVPAFYHCPLVTDENGVRLAKRHASLALRSLRENGNTPQEIRKSWKDNDQ
jgi:glutamyl/glutaminyl-tRNA synthetase